MMILPANEESIGYAAAALRNGELVGMPTETVYGIAAIATDRTAVLKTFALKGRPPENPLIVHVDSIERAHGVVQEFTGAAIALAEAFWPGPLTLVLPKRLSVPDEVTAGLSTVAVRLPDHPIARALIEAAGAPLSAPSANLFSGLSPTRAGHITPEIVSGLACIIDGGPCAVGVESTVVDCTEDRARVLRPGGISRIQVESVVGVTVADNLVGRRSPGMYVRHYSPRTRLKIVGTLGPDDAGITFHVSRNSGQFRLPEDPTQYAARLYAALFRLDQLGMDVICVEWPPETAEWEAVRDRIRKAAGG